MSNAHPPPVPPANRPQQPGADGKAGSQPQPSGKERNLREADGRSQNQAQNTHHQGYQQDR